MEDVDPADWAARTPSPGWSVRDQIAHLAFFDRMAILSVADREQFGTERAKALAATAAYGSKHLQRVPQGGAALLGNWAEDVLAGRLAP